MHLICKINVGKAVVELILSYVYERRMSGGK